MANDQKDALTLAEHAVSIVNGLIVRAESVCENTRNMLDRFRAQRTFHRDTLPPVKKSIRAVYRRFDKKVSIRF